MIYFKFKTQVHAFLLLHKINRTWILPCSKNKINTVPEPTTNYIPSNQCDFCCCLWETSSDMRGFTLASATLMSFSQQSLFLFFVFMSSILEKDCTQRYVVTNGRKNSRAFFTITGYLSICWRQNVESIVVLESGCWTLVLSRYSALTSTVSTANVNGCLTHAGYNSLVGKYPSRDFARSSKCVEIACFSSTATEMSPIPDTSSFLLTQSSRRGKFVKLLFSVHRFCNGSFFFEKFSGFLPLPWCWLHHPASADWGDSELRISHVR